MTMKTATSKTTTKILRTKREPVAVSKNSCKYLAMSMK